MEQPASQPGRGRHAAPPLRPRRGGEAVPPRHHHLLVRRARYLPATAHHSHALKCSSGGGHDDAPHRAPEPVRAARPHSGGRVGHVPTPLVVDHRHTLARRGDRGLSRGHPQFRDKNGRGIGKSQSIWTGSKMETPGSRSHPASQGCGSRSSPPARCHGVSCGSLARRVAVPPLSAPTTSLLRRRG
jgi:hypothetical protein